MISTPLLNTVLALAAEGFRVFPSIEGGAAPAIDAWQRQASYVPSVIRRWSYLVDPVTFEVLGEHSYSVVIATGEMRGSRSFGVVAINAEKAIAGFRSWPTLEASHPKWFKGVAREKTKEGDFQHCFLSEGSSAKSAPKRRSGYVVAAGSVLRGIGPKSPASFVAA